MCRSRNTVCLCQRALQHCTKLRKILHCDIRAQRVTEASKHKQASGQMGHVATTRWAFPIASLARVAEPSHRRAKHGNCCHFAPAHSLHHEAGSSRVQALSVILNWTQRRNSRISVLPSQAVAGACQGSCRSNSVTTLPKATARHRLRPRRRLRHLRCLALATGYGGSFLTTRLGWHHSHRFRLARPRPTFSAPIASALL